MSHIQQKQLCQHFGLTVYNFKYNIFLISISYNEEQIITGYTIDGAMGSSGGGRFRKLSMVCLHNNAIVARGILVTILHCGTPEPPLSAIYIGSSVGTSLLIDLFFCVFLDR